jgi:predicted TPR repeat methyltransferase
VIEYCKLSPADKWRLATEGEASLYLGEVEAALASYAAALALEPDPREIDSMHRQAVWAVRALGDDAAEVKLQALFDNRGLPPAPEPSKGTLGTAETAA